MRKLSQWKMSNEIGYNTDNSFSRRRIMLGTDIRGIMAEEEEVLRRRQALKSLLSMRTKQLRESLEQRIKRAKNGGDWMQLSREDVQPCTSRRRPTSSLNSSSCSMRTTVRGAS
jgi:hypothetical protein